MHKLAQLFQAWAFNNLLFRNRLSKLAKCNIINKQSFQNSLHKYFSKDQILKKQGNINIQNKNQLITRIFKAILSTNSYLQSNYKKSSKSIRQNYFCKKEANSSLNLKKNTKKPNPSERNNKSSTPQSPQQNKEPLNKYLWKGFELDDQIIQYEAIRTQLKITQKKGSETKSKINNYKSFEQISAYVTAEEEVKLKSGYKSLKQSLLKNQKIQKESYTLSAMTDQAIWTNSHQQINLSQSDSYSEGKILGLPEKNVFKCLLAQNYQEQKTDPKGWIISEKLDGVRCLWTGNQMYSRNGNKIYFPSFFTKNWPNSPLDGQLFIGRGDFNSSLSAISKNKPIASEWINVKYMVFDAPRINQPFKNRVSIIKEEISKIKNPFIKYHPHKICAGYDDLKKELEQVIRVGGQGIMLRHPDSFYQGKRSKNLQKAKIFHDDEGQIVSYVDGNGRLSGMVGAFKIKSKNGVQFELGSGLNDQIRQNPPKIGTIVTYKYQEILKQSGKPRFPVFVRIFTKH